MLPKAGTQVCMRRICTLPRAGCGCSCYRAQIESEQVPVRGGCTMTQQQAPCSFIPVSSCEPPSCSASQASWLAHATQARDAATGSVEFRPTSPLRNQSFVINSSSELDAQSFYRRQLPAKECVAFSSPEGRRLFAQALSEGGMEAFFPLSEQFTTQADPGFCGLGALTMSLNALAIDPGRTWKGPWRWFSEEMLECCEPLQVIQKKGIGIDKLDCLARCNGATTKLKYGETTAVEEFREDIIRVSSSDSPPKELLIAGYSRKILGQTGTGHFSPIGGYHSGRDMALILDVARFKYPPHWVSVPLLWEAMQGVDPETQRSRGYLIVGKGVVSESVLFTIDKARYREWDVLCQWISWTAQCIPNLSVWDKRKGPVDHGWLLTFFLQSLPPRIATMWTTYHEAMEMKYDQEYLKSIEQLKRAIEEHPVFRLLKSQRELLRPFSEAWDSSCRVVDERHTLTIIYMSILEWICAREHIPTSGLYLGALYSPSLCIELSQLKRKYAAMVQPSSAPQKELVSEQIMHSALKGQSLGCNVV